MKLKYGRLLYLFLTFIIISLGLLSRRMNDYIPDIIDLFLGDSLWAMMIYFLVRFLFANRSIKKAILMSIIFCFAVEFSQLYHSGWIDMVRRTTLGGLILGYGFLWSDLVAYLLGIGLGAAVDRIIEAY
jgi:glycopeptide antibiotics resistance protein